MAEPVAIRLDRPAVHVEVAPGGEIILRGSLYSRHDGSRLDAATTIWPSTAPGGASADHGGLFDFHAGGFHLVSRDTSTHEVRAVASGHDAPACQRLGVESPCLPLRTSLLARSRLLDTEQFYASLTGTLAIEVVDPPAYVPVQRLAGTAAVQVAGAIIAVIAVAARATVLHLRSARTPAARLAALARRVRRKADAVSPVLSAPLAPALQTACDAVRARRLDAGSPHGLRVAEVLLKLEANLDRAADAQRASEQQRVADTLVREVEIALEAAAEASAAR